MTGTPTPKQEPTSGPSAASKRREANRLAAARFRTRKKDQVTELENKVHDLEAENFHLKAVNRTLRKRCAVPDDQTVEIDDEFAAGRPAWRREVAGERFVSERAASEAAAEFMESPTGGGDPSKKRRRTGPKGSGDPTSSSGGYHHLDRSVSASGDNGDPYVQLQDENDRLQNQMRAYEDRLRNMTDELVGLRYRVREQTGGGSEGSDQSPEANYRGQRHPGPTYAPGPTYTPFTLDPALTGAAGDPRYNGLSPSTSHANPVLTLASAASNARVLQRQPSQNSLVLPLSPAMRLGPDVPPIGYISPSTGSLGVNTLLENTARVSPSMSHQQPYGSRPGSPMTIRAFEALTEAVAAVDAQAAHEASLSSPNAGTAGSGGVARRAWNMQPNNNLGPLTSLSRTSSRGMDSPVSAERSGLLDDEEEESDEYMAAAAGAHLPASSSTRHLAGTSVLSSSRDGSPIGSSLEYFDRRMGGSVIARSTSGTVTASGRGGSKLRDMDIDMDAAPVEIPASGYAPEYSAAPQLDPVLGNTEDDAPESSNATPPATVAILPPAPGRDDGPISQDQDATPTKLHPEPEAVPRIAFQQVQ